MHTKDKGNIALSHAVLWFCEHGYSVFLPVGDNGGCVDLVALSQLGETRRVQCKYTSTLNRTSQAWKVNLTKVPSRRVYAMVKYQPTSFDVLFITTPTDSYMIEWAEWCVHLGRVPTCIEINRQESRLRSRSHLISKL